MGKHLETSLAVSAEEDNPSAGFWRDAGAWHGAVTPLVLPRVMLFGAYATFVCLLAWLMESRFQISLGWEVAPFEIAGAALGLILILRTNAGYDRWWEARKLWGGIVNQSRNLAIGAMAYGPKDPAWKSNLIHWVAAFPHVAKASLRMEPIPDAVRSLIDPESIAKLESANHRPSLVLYRIARLLHEARETFDMTGDAFLQLDRERTVLLDHLGGCERILKTPLPRVYSIKIRRFIAIFLFCVPFALLHRMQYDWLVPVITMLVAYPLVSLDQIGVELQNPFSLSRLNHLPLDTIATNIERNVLQFRQFASDAESIDDTAIESAAV